MNPFYKDGAEIDTNLNIFTDESNLLMYATDASAYREKPLGVLWPKNSSEIREAVLSCREKGLCLIPVFRGVKRAILAELNFKE